MDLRLEVLTRGLESHFRRIERTRMADVPILNPALRVQAVGFERNAEGGLGVLITPWFISLVLLPCEGDDWQDWAVGSRRTRVFASGAYDFLIAEEPPIGRYQSCSLLSPVLELADQDAAIAFAEAALQLLRDPEQRDLESSTRAAEIGRHWSREDGREIESQGLETLPVSRTDQPLGDRPISRPISRRDLLRGRLSGRPPEIREAQEAAE